MITGFPEPSNKNKQWVHTCFFMCPKNDNLINANTMTSTARLIESLLKTISVENTDDWKKCNRKTLKCAEQILAHRLQSQDNENAEIAELYNVMCVLCNNAGLYEKAVEYGSKAIKILEKPFDRDKATRLGGYYCNVAAAYENLAKYEDAFFNLLEGSRLKQFYKLDRARLDERLGNLANKTGRGNVGRELHKYILDLKHRYYCNEDNPDTANSYFSLGDSYRLIHKYIKAIECYSKALEIRIKFFGEDSPAVADVYNAIGQTYQKQKKYDKANEFIEKALAIRERVHEKENIDA